MLLLMDEFKLIKIGLTKNILKTPFCYIHYVFENHDLRSSIIKCVTADRINPKYKIESQV